MEQSANIPRLFHLRMGALLSMLWLVDILLLAFAVESILIEGPTVMIMFASEVCLGAIHNQGCTKTDGLLSST